MVKTKIVTHRSNQYMSHVPIIASEVSEIVALVTALLTYPQPCARSCSAATQCHHSQHNPWWNGIGCQCVLCGGDKYRSCWLKLCSDCPLVPVAQTDPTQYPSVAFVTKSSPCISPWAPYTLLLRSKVPQFVEVSTTMILAHQTEKRRYPWPTAWYPDRWWNLSRCTQLE